MDLDNQYMDFQILRPKLKAAHIRPVSQYGRRPHHADGSTNGIKPEDQMAHLSNNYWLETHNAQTDIKFKPTPQHYKLQVNLRS